MTDDPGSDRTLLERLNALKPSTVSLDPSSKSDLASTIEPAKPLSREDALTERLKSLRNQSERKSHASSGVEANRKDGDIIVPSYPDQTPQPLFSPKSPGTGTGIGASQDSSVEETTDDADPLLFTDDQTLEELLADLESDQPWLDEVAAEEEEHRRVTALLEELGKASTKDPVPDESEAKEVKHENEDGDSDDDDDSDGENMTREIDDALAHAIDEAEWEKVNKPPQPESESTSPSHDVEPSTPDDTENKSTEAPKTNETDPLNLPAVPSDLQDQPALPSSQDDADFAASITSRMAALQVHTPPSASLPSAPPSASLPSAPTSAVDALGLPAAPSFAPADRPAPGVARRVGYSDADQKTWCAVCLEDGAVRCRGCDGDVYCARCWKDMHVGPRAGYEERGHRWERFVRGR
ncbi:hypothetical protein F4819DRAFT_506852 [Hypoxylon fuscum]|nr:hypothetical protein F4819DRAFT_506852 [Hypoxylon fuscum]